jgi:hypothetical protein
MTRSVRLAAVLVLVGCGLMSRQSAPSAGGQVSPAPRAQPAPSAQAQPAPLSGFEDRGVFLLYQNEDRVGTITFRWQADGTFDNEIVLSLAGQTATITDSVVVDKDGQWVRMTTKSAQGPIEAVREGGIARVTVKGKSQTVTLQPGTRMFGNYGPALMSQAVRLYDQAKGGKQSFPLLVIPGAMLTASLEYKDTVERSVGGTDVRFTRYVHGFPGVDITVWVGQDGKVYLGDVPAQHAAYVRQVCVRPGRSHTRAGLLRRAGRRAGGEKRRRHEEGARGVPREGDRVAPGHSRLRDRAADGATHLRRARLGRVPHW